MTVLILARDVDPSADRLVETLDERNVPVFRTDLVAFPQALTLDARLGPGGWDGVLANQHREVRLSEIRSIWYRHPSHFELPEGMSGPERRHAAAEARCGLAGVLSSLDVLWVNYPARESDALKPRQLHLARRCGLRVPDSLVTNQPEGVRDFACSIDGALAGKTLAAALLVESGRLQVAYTRRIERSELNDLAGVNTTMHLFQEFIDNKAFEVRVTVIGKKVFAAAIHANSDTARVDFRSDYGSLDYESIEPPEPVITGMLAFMKTFGLSFGAFDFAVTPDEEWKTGMQSLRGLRVAGGCAGAADHRGAGRSAGDGSRTVVSYPTDLTPHEQQIAQRRLRVLADEFTAEGALRTPQWREVFHRTWRHPYIPIYYPELGAPCILSIDPNRRGEWLDAVYSDQTLITKVVQVPMSRALRPGTYPMYASSSTLPSLVLRMLEELAVTDGCWVLEIGTGSGYNTALLCERLGSDYVTSVDIDPELIELATERLTANGYTPTLATVDGAGGYPPCAPYDRIIATCSVPAIPAAWLQQAAPGAVILADVRGQIGGTVARLTVEDDGTARGHFLPLGTSFMWLRHTPDFPPPRLIWEDGSEPTDSITSLDPTLLHTDSLFGFVAQWHLPGVTWGQLTDDGAPGVHLWSPDGSRASVRSTPHNGNFPVTQVGSQRLWDRVEQAHEFWQRAGRPHYDQFGITATATDQHVWYADPNSEHRWALPPCS